MHHDTALINMLAIGLGFAFVLGVLANKLRLSPLVGYLVAGVIVGPFTPGFVADQALANQLAEIGVMLLMFGVGLHFSLKDLMAVKAIAIPGAVGQILVATLLGWGVASVMGWPVLHGVIFGFSLATASTVVLLRAMEERRLLETTRGKIAVGWLIVEDLACVLALVMMPVIADVFGPDASGKAPSIAGVLASIGWTFVQLGLFVAVMLLVGRRVIPWVLEKVAGTGSRELFTLCVLAIALGVAFGAAALFGVSFALGAFFAGMMLNESELSHKAAHDSLPLRDAFAVLFFVSVGMLFNPMILVEHPWQVLATVAIIMFGKSAAAFFIVRAFGHSKSTALTISASLAQIGEFASSSPDSAWRWRSCPRPDSRWCWPAPWSRSCSTRWCSACSTAGRPSIRSPPRWRRNRRFRRARRWSCRTMPSSSATAGSAAIWRRCCASAACRCW